MKLLLVTNCTMSENTEPTPVTELGLPTEDPAESRERARRIADPTEVQRFVIEAAQLISDSHGEDVIIFDVRDKSQITDYLVIGSGTSDRQIRSVGSEVSQLGKQKYNFDRFGREEDGPSKWLVLDFVDVVIHLFEPVTRAFYDLEMMWGDAPRIEWRREGDPRKNEQSSD